MFKPVRVIASVIFILSIGLVFVGAFVIGNGVLCIGRCLYHSSFLNSAHMHFSIRCYPIFGIDLVQSLVNPKSFILVWIALTTFLVISPTHGQQLSN